MAGRKRLAGARYPSGGRKREERDGGYPPTVIKRLADAAVAGMRDPEWATVIGVYFLQGKLTSAQYAAGKKWAILWAEYCILSGFPAPSPKAVVIGATRSEPPDPDSDAGRAQAKKALKTRKAFDAAHRALVACGMQAEAATRKLCEGLGETPGSYEQFLHAKRGLEALAKLWA